MGWTKLGIYAKPVKVDYDVFLKHESQPDTVRNTLQTDLEYPFCAQDLDKDQLPFIPPEVVKQHNVKAEDRLCKFNEMQMLLFSATYHLQGIVIDEIVYDCSDFISTHPGGEAVICNLSGSDCSCKLDRPKRRSSFKLTCGKGSSGGFIVPST